MFNARSICNKFPDLYALLSCNMYDLIFVTETWTHADIPDSMVTLKFDYDLLRNDRVGHRGGGVILLFRKYLSVSNVIPPLNLQLTETLIFDLTIKTQTIRFLWFIVVLSMTRIIMKNYVNSLNGHIKALNSQSYSEILIFL